MNPLADPALLFFVLGVGAGLMRSNLEVPPQLSRFLSLYLLMALGLKGVLADDKLGLYDGLHGARRALGDERSPGSPADRRQVAGLDQGGEFRFHSALPYR